MQFSEIIPLLEKVDSPIGWAFLGVIVLPSVVFRVIRAMLHVRTDFRHDRTKNIEFALSKVDAASVERSILEECKVQELVYLNTKLNLSRVEREQIYSWLLNKPVTINLIKKAWSNIKYENGQLIPCVLRYEAVYMGYSLLTTIGLFSYGTYLLIKLIVPILAQSAYQYFILPIVIYLFAYIVFKQAEPIMNARQLILRLGQATEPNNGLCHSSEFCRIDSEHPTNNTDVWPDGMQAENTIGCRSLT